ncbi:MAG: hypothetical protein LAT64_12990 [Phycisphaerales bacterium]|nr:hypothetical protein [Planctomycetota bacterium]MCH8509670.1 hypothetical protein [Phycisphaerales bacterium]
MYDFFFKHYALDWAAAVFMFLSMWRLGKHRRDGFVLAAIASGFWIAFNVKVDSAGGIIANAVILAMAVRSFTTFKQGSGISHEGSGGEKEAEIHASGPDG